MMRKCLLTGATGFVGSALARELNRKGIEVHALVRADSDTSRLDESTRLHHRDPKATELRMLLSEVEPDVIIHVASLFLVSHRDEDIDPLIDSNITLGTHLLEAMKQTGIRKLINIGTYWQNYEDENYDPVNLYAATKEAFQRIIDFYSNEGSLDCITLKLYNVYGPGDPRRKVLNLLYEAAQKGDELGMSPGEQPIELLHIEDAISGIWRAMEVLDKEQARGHTTYTLEPEEKPNLRQLVEMFQEATGLKVRVHWGERPYRDREVMSAKSRGKVLPGWQPLVSILDGLKASFGQKE